MKTYKTRSSLAGILACFGIIALAPEAFALNALEPWDTAARDALATPVKIWLGLMMLINISAIGFFKNHVAARWVFAGFVISHGIVMVMWNQGITVLAGQVSLFHVIFWTPGMLALLRYRNEIKIPSTYGIWASLSLILYFVSMLIDIKDAFIYVRHAMGG